MHEWCAPLSVAHCRSERRSVGGRGAHGTRKCPRVALHPRTLRAPAEWTRHVPLASTGGWGEEGETSSKNNQSGLEEAEARQCRGGFRISRFVDAIERRVYRHGAAERHSIRGKNDPGQLCGSRKRQGALQLPPVAEVGELQRTALAEGTDVAYTTPTGVDSAWSSPVHPLQARQGSPGTRHHGCPQAPAQVKSSTLHCCPCRPHR